MNTTTWEAFILLTQQEEIEYLNDEARRWLGLHQKTQVTVTLRQLLRKFAAGDLTVRRKPVSEEVAVFTGDVCAFTAAGALEVHHAHGAAGEILLLTRNEIPFQDEPSIHQALSQKIHSAVLSSSLNVETLTVYDQDNGVQVLKEPGRLNSAGMLCFKRIVSSLLMSDRPFGKVNQLLVWPTVPASLVQWVLKSKGWANGSSVISLPFGAKAGSRQQTNTTCHAWQLLQLSFTSLPLQRISQSTFSESSDNEMLWLIPASAEEYLAVTGS